MSVSTHWEGWYEILTVCNNYIWQCVRTSDIMYGWAEWMWLLLEWMSISKRCKVIIYMLLCIRDKLTGSARLRVGYRCFKFPCFKKPVLMDMWHSAVQACLTWMSSVFYLCAYKTLLIWLFPSRVLYVVLKSIWCLSHPPSTTDVFTECQKK